MTANKNVPFAQSLQSPEFVFTTAAEVTQVSLSESPSMLNRIHAIKQLYLKHSAGKQAFNLAQNVARHTNPDSERAPSQVANDFYSGASTGLFIAKRVMGNDFEYEFESALEDTIATLHGEQPASAESVHSLLDKAYDYYENGTDNTTENYEDRFAATIDTVLNRLPHNAESEFLFKAGYGVTAIALNGIYSCRNRAFDDIVDQLKS